MSLKFTHHIIYLTVFYSCFFKDERIANEIASLQQKVSVLDLNIFCLTAIINIVESIVVLISKPRRYDIYVYILKMIFHGKTLQVCTLIYIDVLRCIQFSFFKERDKKFHTNKF